MTCIALRERSHAGLSVLHRSRGHLVPAASLEGDAAQRRTVNLSRASVRAPPARRSGSARTRRVKTRRPPPRRDAGRRGRRVGGRPHHRAGHGIQPPRPEVSATTSIREARSRTAGAPAGAATGRSMRATVDGGSTRGAEDDDGAAAGTCGEGCLDGDRRSAVTRAGVRARGAARKQRRRRRQERRRSQDPSVPAHERRTGRWSSAARRRPRSADGGAVRPRRGTRRVRIPAGSTRRWTGSLRAIPSPVGRGARGGRTAADSPALGGREGAFRIDGLVPRRPISAAPRVKIECCKSRRGEGGARRTRGPRRQRSPDVREIGGCAWS
jgi:hypothetical protein